METFCFTDNSSTYTFHNDDSSYDCYYSFDDSLAVTEESSIEYTYPQDEYSDELLFQCLHTMGMVEADGTTVYSSESEYGALPESIALLPKTQSIALPPKNESIAILPKPSSNNNIISPIKTSDEPMVKKSLATKRTAANLDGTLSEKHPTKRQRKYPEASPTVLVHRCTPSSLDLVIPNSVPPNSLPDPVLKERLTNYLSLHKLKQWHIAKALYTNTTLVSNWMNNKPRVHGWERFEGPLRQFLDNAK